jgi:hypothetical protein
MSEEKRSVLSGVNCFGKAFMWVYLSLHFKSMICGDNGLYSLDTEFKENAYHAT